jgi:hypothetical protein
LDEFTYLLSEAEKFKDYLLKKILWQIIFLDLL